MTLKRRDFLKIGGGLSLSFPLINCIPESSYNTTSKSSWLAGIERWVPSICRACPGGCGIMVRLIDDRAVKIEGNPLHSLNEGKLCPKGQAALQLLYHPERIRGPMKKVGDRGGEQWESITWEEALTAVSRRLGQLRESGLSHSVAFFSTNEANTSNELVARFLKVFGSPNLFLLDEWDALRNAYYVTQGIEDLMAYDLDHSRMILSFGAKFLTHWPNIMENQRVYGKKRAEREQKIIQIDPRFSLEASRADSWIPVNQGSEGLLALGIASVLIKERLYDREYIDRFTSQFNAFRDYILQNIQLDRVSEMTGVPLSSIIEIAKEFTARRPAVAVADPNLAYNRQGLFNVLAVHSLNALIGNIDSPGGLLRRRPAPLAEMPPVTLDDVAERAASIPKLTRLSEFGEQFLEDRKVDVLDRMLKQTPYGINCLLISSPVPRLLTPLSHKKSAVLANIPFIVSFSSFMDELTSLADLVLPDTTFFEKWQDHHSSPLSKIPIVGISRPAVQPLYQSRPFESTLLSLAKAMGENFALNFPWTDYSDLLLSRTGGLFQSQKGTIFTSTYQEAQLRILEERGWWTPQHDSRDAFVEDLLEKGGWQDPVYHFNERSYVYLTRSRRFFFAPIRELAEETQHPDTNPNDFPLRLHLFDLPFTTGESNCSSLPWFQENLGFRFGFLWKIWAELNPLTAEELGIHDEDMIWVESSEGRMKVVARIFPGVGPGIVSMPLNKSVSPLSQWDDSDHVDPRLLLPDGHDERTGMPDRNSTRVRIYKVKRRQTDD